MLRFTLASVLLSLIASLAAVARPGDPPQEPEVVATFSVVGYDPDTMEWGVAVASKFLAVGSVVPWAEAGVGAVATQSFANVTFGPKGLELMRKGKSAEDALKALTDDDEGRDVRQVGMIDAKGEAATYTGKKCNAWAGGKTGKHYACQGNILSGPEVVDAMAKVFEDSKGLLAWRLMASLEAGDKAGGDKRGKQSAAMMVYEGRDYPSLSLRVDDHEEPLAELRRLYRIWLGRFAAYVTIMPTEDNPSGIFDRAVLEAEAARREALLAQGLPV
mgnify:CR=1 FL=1